MRHNRLNGPHICGFLRERTGIWSEGLRCANARTNSYAPHGVRGVASGF